MNFTHNVTLALDRAAMRRVDQVIELFCGCLCGRPRLVPVFGVVSESAGPPARTDPRHVGGPPPGAPRMANFQMTDSQQTTLHIQAVDKRGNPVAATTDQDTWLVDNPNVVTLTPSADGQSCQVVAAGPVGDFTVTVNAQVGGVDVSGTLAGSVVSGAATQVQITADAPTDQP